MFCKYTGGFYSSVHTLWCRRLTSNKPPPVSATMRGYLFHLALSSLRCLPADTCYQTGKSPIFWQNCLGKHFLFQKEEKKKKKKSELARGNSLDKYGGFGEGGVHSEGWHCLIHASPSAHSSGWMFLMVLGPFHIRHYCNPAIKAQHSRSRWGFLGESAHTFLLNKKHSLRLQKSLPPST